MPRPPARPRPRARDGRADAQHRAPSASAARQSCDMPMERVSPSRPAARIASSSLRSTANSARAFASSPEGLAMPMSPRNRSPGRDAMCRARASASPGFTPPLVASWLMLTSTQTFRGALPAGRWRERTSASLSVDAVHPVELHGDFPRLVALERADEVQVAGRSASASILATASCTYSRRNRAARGEGLAHHRRRMVLETATSVIARLSLVTPRKCAAQFLQFSAIGDIIGSLSRRILLWLNALPPAT